MLIDNRLIICTDVSIVSVPLTLLGHFFQPEEPKAFKHKECFFT